MAGSLLLFVTVSLSAQDSTFVLATADPAYRTPAFIGNGAFSLVSSPLGTTRAPVGTAGSGALTGREHEVLALLVAGRSNREIAKQLYISEKTVRNHLSHLFDKLGVWSRAQAIVFARDRGFSA